MPIDPAIWHRYDAAARGLPVERTADFEWMVEDPDEFDLRMLLRHFEQRETLLERIGEYEHGATSDFGASDVEALAGALADAYRTVAADLTPDVFDWARGPASLRVRMVPSDHPGSKSLDYRWLHEAVSDAATPQLARVPGGLALRALLMGRVHGLGMYHLLDPVLEAQWDFSAELQLRRGGWGIWIESGELVLRDPVPDPWSRLDSSPEWKPVLDWPTDEEIELHLAAD